MYTTLNKLMNGGSGRMIYWMDLSVKNSNAGAKNNQEELKVLKEQKKY
ncbi:TPA: hypothetical protein ACJG01_004711 [Salmonella enterica subsp. salamae serovar 21:z10:[z6]]|uniref:Uncharacterized protein n=2 Tax=Salmonella enterica subsp. salamae TaxID=59202 RepID=A0A728XYW7_SALER|nr:hypothetical protein [Salmonella enterica]EDU0568004.1 hypothetical protein [Salmonella enterica subsp. salamae]EKR2157994.1 hypothetical protein [Salmonella enterica subsp. salamae serovar 40:c:z6]MBA2991633.1 hypothetical protein [Salmonella enterica subsp. salamae serovar 47:z:e,n,x,z15]HAE8257843.1 hypothetical protein [Salmonella enterica subsp. salamae serovar 42:b:1,5]HCM1871201.1 hypothetical protein [Salmonella enterica subsp. salamae serovar 58:a:z6]HCM1899652.1 hypothetical prot